MDSQNRIQMTPQRIQVPRGSLTPMVTKQYVSFLELVKRFRLQKAVHLLVHEAYTIQAIARMVGYPDIKISLTE